MKPSKFLKGAGMLAALGLIAKLIGVFYRLPLTNILGAEGMGMYQMIFPVYSLTISLIAGGMTVAMSKCTGELSAQGDETAAKSALKLALVIMTVLGLVVATLLVVFRTRIASGQGNRAASIAYIAIAPATALSGIIAALRGYFQGKSNMLPSGVSQLIEQAAKVAIGLTLAAYFAHMGIEFSVFGALLGVSLGEIAAAFYLVIRYAVHARKSRKTPTHVSIIPTSPGPALDPTLALAEPVLDSATTPPNPADSPVHTRKSHKNPTHVPKNLAYEAASDIALPLSSTTPPATKNPTHATKKTLLRRIYAVALPVTLGSLVMPLSQAVDSFLVINLLRSPNATSLFGLMSGPVGSLVGLPTVISAALSASLLPVLASGGGAEAADRSMAASIVTLFPCTFVFFVAPEPILRILYSSGLTESELAIAATLLRIESVNALLLGVIQIAATVEQSLGRAIVPVVCLAVGVALKVLATVFLTPRLGIYGAALGTVICYAVTCTLDLVFAKKSCSLLSKKRLTRLILCTLTFALCMSSYFVTRRLGEILGMIIAATLSLAAYFAVLSKTKCILLSEMLL